MIDPELTGALEESEKSREMKIPEEIERKKKEGELENLAGKVANSEKENELHRQSEIELQNEINHREKESSLSEERITEIELNRERLEMEESKIQNEINRLENLLSSIRNEESELTKIYNPKSGKNSAEQVKVQNFYISEAKEVLRGKVLTANEMFDLAKRLKIVKAFNYARRILARAAADLALN